ncbi:DUF1279 super [Cladophialophora chaetospira]|uniref:DUF1279 super n=1 Tax=Cladophialophora chaetospira TaxID=386627 RepID=A0AA39CH07_9EURO|nr:DUF1279 super [Cladophialophora chaetospira]
MRELLAARPALRSAVFQSRAPLQQSFRTRPTPQRTHLSPSISHSIHTQRSTLSTPSQALRNLRRQRKPNNGRRHNSTSGPEPQPTTLSARLKKMSREYGWTAVGVYFALSALDFPFCFLAVRMIGTDTIGHYEHVIVENIKGVLKWPIKGTGLEASIDGAVDAGAGGDEVNKVEMERSAPRRVLEDEGADEVVDHGYRDAERANRGDNASLWTQLALAYAVHKSFIFIRVPLTAAILPKVVKTLRSWGYNIGKMPKKKAVTAGTGVNTKGSGVK